MGERRDHVEESCRDPKTLRGTNCTPLMKFLHPIYGWESKRRKIAIRKDKRARCGLGAHLLQIIAFLTFSANWNKPMTVSKDEYWTLWRIKSLFSIIDKLMLTLRSPKTPKKSQMPALLTNKSRFRLKSNIDTILVDIVFLLAFMTPVCL